ncbi:type IV pilus assembly protein PilM [Patescibacteria group bacterium]|jgi:type IV pilus assembly protein PilM|nr:type IV pilus assembly protein PilM [Patescibacteria group bacterium]
MGFLDNLPTDLDSLKATLSSFGSRGSGSVVGIDIGSSAIKVVQLRNEDGAAVLETYGELSLGPYQDIEIGRSVNLDVDRLAEALRDILHEANVTTKDCGVSIPFASSLITLLELPQVDSKTLKSMIPLEARKYIPVPISEVQLDWFVVPEGDLKYLSKEEKEEAREAAQDGKHADTINVLLVAIHNEISRKYETILKAADLKPTFFEIEIFSSIRAILGRGVAPVVVLDIGAARSKLYIVEAGIVRSTHVINRGSQDITLTFAKSTGIPVTKAEELKREYGLDAQGAGEHGPRLAQTALSGMEYIFAEAERAILAYQRRYHANITQVMLTGGGATLKGLLPLAQKKFEREVLLADPFKKTRSPAFLEEVLKEAGPEFAVAVGLALRKLQG